MKLCRIKRPLWGGSPERIVLENNLSLGILVVVHKSFDPETTEIPIVNDNDSYQVRPKALYKSQKGYYWKEGTKVYLSKEESQTVDTFLETNNYIILPKDKDERSSLKNWGQ